MRPRHKVRTQSPRRKTLPSRVSAFNPLPKSSPRFAAWSRLHHVGGLGKSLKNCPAGRNSAGTFKQTTAFMQHGRAGRVYVPAYCSSCSVEQKLGSQRLEKWVDLRVLSLVILSLLKKAHLCGCAQSMRSDKQPAVSVENYKRIRSNIGWRRALPKPDNSPGSKSAKQNEESVPLTYMPLVLNFQRRIVYRSIKAVNLSAINASSTGHIATEVSN